jgi:hypothetical protein
VTNSEDPIDTLIDDVARRMTEGAPAANFTARVLERIDERQPRLRWRWVWVAGPLVAAAVVLIAMQIGRVRPGIYSVPSEVRLPPSASPAEAFGNGGRPSVDVTRRSPEPVEGPDAGDMKPRVTGPKRNVAEVRSASTVDPLAPPRLDVTPLDVTPLEADATSPDTIEVEHLETIAPIAVTPLDVRR